MATAEELFTPHKADALLIVRFYHDTELNKFKSHEEGRPIFDDIEMCEVNIPADRARSVIAPAHAGWKKFGTNTVTYAERFKEHYARFKANEGPIVEGTPLAEAPFLTMADKASLKALQVYTIEQLASLTGQALKNIGHGGLIKQQSALAYLSKASGTADTAKMQRTIAELQAQIAAMTPPAVTEPAQPAIDFSAWEDNDLKDYIEQQAGTRPRGNPNHDTLVRMASDVTREAPAAVAA